MAIPSLAGTTWTLTLGLERSENLGTLSFDGSIGGHFTSPVGQKFPFEWKQVGDTFAVKVIAGQLMLLEGSLEGSHGSGTITESPPPPDGPAEYPFAMAEIV